MKKGKHPTTSRRNRRKKVIATFSKAREAAQLEGVLPTEPAGAVRDEVVPPHLQDEQRFPGLDRVAIRNDGKGWSVPEHVKRKVIETAAEVVFERKTYFNSDGVEVEVPADRYAQAQASRTLLTADEKQWEREKPEEAGKARGAAQVNILNGEFWDKLAQQVEGASDDLVEKRLEAAKVEVENTKGEGEVK